MDTKLVEEQIFLNHPKICFLIVKKRYLSIWDVFLKIKDIFLKFYDILSILFFNFWIIAISIFLTNSHRNKLRTENLNSKSLFSNRMCQKQYQCIPDKNLPP